MSTIDADRVQDLFREVLGLVPADRARHLDEKCDDPELRCRVDELLRHDEMASGFLEPSMARSADPQPQERTTLAAETVIGPYRIVAPIGAGGMGSVYLAAVERSTRGAAAGDRVAIKVVHPYLFAREGFFARFLREADVGRRVRHENVVRVIGADAIEIDGRVAHLLVMEYVEGRTLRELLRDLGTVPEALLREIAAQMSAGLAAVHAEGIVHRDVKPENVLITDDHRVRLMDLGVAHVTDDSMPLTREGDFIGSLAYASPEQFGKGDVGPAADLYSLGVVLYELATGENPFLHAEMSRTIAAHLNDVPSRAIERNADLSPFISEFVGTLLAKSASERIESADHVQTILRAAERSEWWAERRARAEHLRTALPRIAVSRETALCGREGELTLLRSVWARAERGEGSTVLLEGEAGIGKTRLVDTFLRGLTASDARVLYGSYPPAGGMGGLSDAILEHFGTLGLAESLAPYLTAMPSLVPAFAAVLRHEHPNAGAEPLGKDALHAVFCQLMQALADERPLVWVVDDLHFASADSREVLLSLARALRDRPVLLLLTTRPRLPQEEMAKFGRLDNFERTHLGRLGAREVVQLLRDAFRSDALADRLAGQIAYKSDGVPFFVFEMIRGLREGQFITQLPDGTWVETKMIQRIEVPSAVRDLIEARLGSLTNDERALLDVGAVLGFTFDPDLVARVLERRRIHVLQDLAAIERRSGVVRGEGNDVRFDHHQIQEVIYDDLLPALRSEYHAAIADALEVRESAAKTDPATLRANVAALLCEHFLKGGRDDRALRYLDAALTQLEGGYQHESAVELCDQALAASQVLTGRARADVLLHKASRLRLLGRRDDERAALQEVQQFAEQTSDDELLVRVHRKFGGLLRALCDFDAADEAFGRAMALARATEHRHYEAEIAGDLCSAYTEQGRYQEAQAHGDRSLAMFCELGDRRGEARIARLRGHVAVNQGRHEEARLLYERCQTISRELRERSGEAHSLSGLGSVLAAEGRHENALDCYRLHLQICEETGDRLGAARTTTNLGLCHYELGAFDEALRHSDRARTLALELGNGSLEHSSAQIAGCVQHSLGRLASSQMFVERSLAIARDLGLRREEATALGNLGSGYLELGDPARAREHLNRSAELAETMQLRTLVTTTRMLHGIRAELEGEIDEAEQLYRAAIAAQREMNRLDQLSYTLTRLGALLVSRGRHDTACAPLEEALEIAAKIDAPDAAVLAAAYLALAQEADASTAVARLEQHGPRMDFIPAMEARFALWNASRNAEHLEEAHRKLTFLSDHAPEEYRESMLTNVPLHRDIAAAWEKHRGDG